MYSRNKNSTTIYKECDKVLENQNDIKKLISSLIRYFTTENNFEIAEFLNLSSPSLEEVDYDNWNGGTYYYALIFELEIERFVHYRPFIDSFCSEIKEAADLFIYSTQNQQLVGVTIRPICKHYLNWNSLPANINKKIILEKIEELKNIMTDVSTGGSKIQTVDQKYRHLYCILDEWLITLGIENPNPYKGLWDWYNRWKQNDLSTYASRRAFIPELYQSLIDIINSSAEDSYISEYIPTGWERVDRTIYEMKKGLSSASTEEQFQAIGMLGRETIITIAQEVYDKTIHSTLDGVEPSVTDAKRMLDAFLNYNLSGSSNERTRKFAKSAVDMANHLTHDRMAIKRDATMCLVSVTAVASLIKLIHDSPE